MLGWGCGWAKDLSKLEMTTDRGHRKVTAKQDQLREDLSNVPV